MRRLAIILAGLAACASPGSSGDDVDASRRTFDAGPVVDGGRRDDALVQAPDSGAAEPMAGIYDEVLLLINDSCGTGWISPQNFVTTVQLDATQIMFTNTNGTATYQRTGTTTFMATIGSSVNTGTWLTPTHYQIAIKYSYQDSGRSCVTDFSLSGVHR